ncbi:MAG: FAD-binding oxidoreductase [Candidatus Thermoplasmatota archaeon]|nr:FAD-binding oxidoreductase [Candidatus Thermoplasmatota archaeon]MCL6003002.1 FAD-binding oxidoreductase [Candidatus Thermoplasmatota archaeon]
MDPDFDYVIVGAGSTGTSISYYLRRYGKRVLLLDSRGIAAGNTAKSSALIRTHYSNELIAAMGKYSYDVISNFDSIGFSGLHQPGMLFPFDEKYRETAKENVEMLRRLGIEEVELSPKEIEKHFPGVSLKGFDYVVLEPHSGYADPVAVSNSYAEEAKKNGVNIKVGKEVVRIEPKKYGVVIYLSDGSSISGKKVILATNVWTNRLLGNSGLSKGRLFPITTSQHAVIYLKRPPMFQGEKPVLWDPPNLAYYKMEGSTLLALGSLDPEIDNRPVNLDDNLSEEADYEYIEDYVGRLVSRIPGMGDATIISSLTGLYDMTPDGQAIISHLDALGFDGVYVCAGLSGHGFKLSPAYGLITSEMVTDIDPDKATFDWRNFSPFRFREGKFITSKYTRIGTIY